MVNTVTIYVKGYIMAKQNTRNFKTKVKSTAPTMKPNLDDVKPLNTHLDDMKYQKKVATPDEHLKRLGLKLISIRLKPAMIQNLKTIAMMEGVAYQTLIKRVLDTYIREFMNGNENLNWNIASLVNENIDSTPIANEQTSNVAITDKQGKRISLKPISIRLKPTMIQDLKTIATMQGVGYQTLIKSVLEFYILSCMNANQ